MSAANTLSYSNMKIVVWFNALAWKQIRVCIFVSKNSFRIQVLWSLFAWLCIFFAMILTRFCHHLYVGFVTEMWQSPKYFQSISILSNIYIYSVSCFECLLALSLHAIRFCNDFLKLSNFLPLSRQTSKAQCQQNKLTILYVRPRAWA